MLVCMPNNPLAWRTNWIKPTIVMDYGSLNLAPNETRPIVFRRHALQSNLCAHSVVRREYRSSPFSNQSTTRDKNKIFHVLYV